MAAASKQEVILNRVLYALLAIVAVLSSLYPIAMLMLARVVLGERLTCLQQSGFVAAMVATTLIAI